MSNNREVAKDIRLNKHLDLQQKQLVLGALLGDSSMFLKDNGARGIQFCHGYKQLEYLEWKRNILYPFILSEKPASYTGYYGGMANNYRSIIHQDFTDIYGLLYRKIEGKSKKFVTRKYLNMLNSFGVLVWFMDDGTITQDKEARIATNGFTLSEQNAIKIWFWQKYRIELMIAFNKTNKSYFIRFNVLNTKRLMRLFKEYISFIPECLQYKFRFHFNLNDYTLNCYTISNIHNKRYSLNTVETL